jgi:RNA polymerase sigma factor (sigma-70 family)
MGHNVALTPDTLFTQRPQSGRTKNSRVDRGIISTMKSAPTSASVAGISNSGNDASHAEQERARALLKRMSNGEEPALGELYDLTIGRVYGFALRIVGHSGTAEEVASDVYLQAWKEAGRYDADRAKVLTWMLMICRSRALDRLRSRGPEVLHEAPETLVENEPDDGGAPPDLLEAMQSEHAVHVALATLSPIQRQLVGLAFFRGLSHQEIADHAQLPLGTVKSHIRRALDGLRAALPPGIL